MSKRKFGIPPTLPPSRCPVCGGKLGESEYKRSFFCVYDDHWRIECQCGVYLRWSFPNVWKQFHFLPLWEFIYGKGRVHVSSDAQ
jgi:hypothetical protein